MTTSTSLVTCLPWDTPRWETFTETMATRRRQFAAAVVDNQFFVFGGYNGSRRLSSAEMFCLDTRSWTLLPSMPTARDACAAVAVENHVYVVGGANNHGTLKTMEMLDTETMEWKSLPSMPTPRWGCGAVVVGKQIIVIGGYNSGSLRNDVESYHVDTQQWTTLPCMPTARHYFACAVVDDGVFVFGGIGGDTSVEMFHTQTQSWTSTLVPPMPFCRESGAAIAIGKHIVLVGGSDGSEKLKRADMFDTESRNWISLPFMNTKREYCAVAFIQNHLIVAGGYDEHGNNLDTVESMAMDTIFPIPPKISPMPVVTGKRQRKVALQKWLKETIAIKADFLKKMDARTDDINKMFSKRRDELVRQLQCLDEWNGKLLEMSREGDWVETLNDQIDDAQDELKDLIARLNASEKPRRPEYTKQGKRAAPWSHLMCPLTGKLMTDPVVAADGRTYERSAIEAMMASVPKGQDVPSPVTREILAHRMVIPNVSIQDQIRSFHRSNPRLLHAERASSCWQDKAVLDRVSCMN